MLLGWFPEHSLKRLKLLALPHLENNQGQPGDFRLTKGVLTGQWVHRFAIGASSQWLVLEGMGGKSCSEQHRKVTTGFRCKTNLKSDII